jgi:hypothetical protein
LSRWLEQLKAKYPDVEFFDVLPADYGSSQVSAATCNTWMSNNSITHPVLRDVAGSGSIMSTLGLQSFKYILIVDRYLKIVYKSQVTDTFGQNQVLNALGQLK